MAITDLTGTTWYWNDYADPYGASVDGNNYNINFTDANETSYTQIGFFHDYIDYYVSPSSNIHVFDVSGAGQIQGWQDETYRTITITGGTDATNTTLIAFIEANATVPESVGGVAT